MPTDLSNILDIRITLANGTQISPFNSFTLSQSILQHHTFEVRCDHEVLESPDAEIISATLELVGIDITVTMKSGSGSPENTFKGVITEVGMIQGDGVNHEIVIKGFSSTIKMENGPNLAVYKEKSITDIAKQICSKSSIKKVGNIQFAQNLKYCTQFNESDFQFLRRLAAIHGEWFYYDGKDLVFGEPANIPSINLTYMQNLMTLSTFMGAAPVKFNTSSYNSGYDGIETELFKDASASMEGGDNFSTKMFSKSKTLYPDNFNTAPRHVYNDKDGLKNYTKAQTNSIAAGMVHVQASSDNPNVAIGSVADIQTENGNSYGSFFITSITHQCDGMGHYSNNFTGIPKSLKTLPNPYYQKPVASAEMAQVTKVDDPEKRGRVRVRFIWMQPDEETWWMPTTQPYGGESNSESHKNRGIIFIPEIGDDVLIGFEKGDYDRPYVSQTLMNSKNIEFVDADYKKNLRKLISTRDTGLIFLDKDPDGPSPVGIGISVWNGDSTPKTRLLIKDVDGKASAELKAIDEIIIMSNGEEVKLNMKKDGTITITGKKITIDASDTLTLKGDTVDIQASGELKAKANKNVTIEAMQNIELKATQKLTGKGNMGAEIDGGLQTDIKGTMVNVKGSAMLDLDGGAMSVLKGGMVMIN